MKFISLLLYSNLFLLSLSAQKNAASDNITAKIDPRIELLSIVFRLAESPEYSQGENKLYVRDIHQHFDQYKQHPLIRFAKKISDSNNIGFDQVMSMAIQLKQPPSLDPIIPFSKQLPGADWNLSIATEFVSLLKNFYNTTGFASFFKSNTSVYRMAEQKFGTVLNELHMNWYKDFYGKSPKGTFYINIGYGNGGANYGPKLIMPDKSEKIYAIMGSWKFDSTGVPFYESDAYLPTLIHEFNHSYVNYLGDIYRNNLAQSGATIFNAVKEKMERMAYSNWKTMLDEALVRASVIKYLRRYNTDTMVAYKELREQEAMGFVWMKDLVTLLNQYDIERKTYPTLESFMPRIISFYEKTASHIQTYVDTYNNACGQIVGVYPFNNNATDVSPKTATIRFQFDKPLEAGRYSFGKGDMGAEHYAKPTQVLFTNNNTSISISVQLKPNTVYQIKVRGNNMRTMDGYIVKDYLLNFKTGSEE